MLFWLQNVFEVWYFLQESAFPLFVVNLATEVLLSVACDYIWNPQWEVVSPYLVEHLLADSNAWCFILNNDERLSVLAINHGVASFLHLSHF